MHQLQHVGQSVLTKIKVSRDDFIFVQTHSKVGVVFSVRCPGKLSRKYVHCVHLHPITGKKGPSSEENDTFPDSHKLNRTS